MWLVPGKRGKPANPAMPLSYERPTSFTIRLLHVATIDALVCIIINLEGMGMQRRTRVLRILSLRISYWICMRHNTYHDLRRYASRATRLNHVQAMIMGYMLWNHYWWSEPATHQSLHVSASYAVYPYVFMDGLLRNMDSLYSIHRQVAMASEGSVSEDTI